MPAVVCTESVFVSFRTLHNKVTAAQSLLQGFGWTYETVLLCAPALPFSVIVQITQEICAPVRSRVLQLQKNLPRFQRAA